MRKRIAAFAMAMSLLLCSCGGESASSAPAPDHTAVGFSHHSTLSKEEALTEPISLWSAWRNGILRPFSRPDTTHPLTFSWLEAQFPIQCTRTPTANGAYCLYKTGDGGLLYVFFSKEGTEYRYSHWAYMEQRLKLEDFAHLQLGDLRNEVYLVDPGLRTLINATEAYPLLIQWSPYIDKETTYSFHILEDCLLVIRYDKDNRIQQMIVQDDYVYTIKAGDKKMDYSFVIFADDFAPPPTMMESTDPTA